MDLSSRDYVRVSCRGAAQCPTACLLVVGYTPAHQYPSEFPEQSSFTKTLSRYRLYNHSMGCIHAGARGAGGAAKPWGICTPGERRQLFHWGRRNLTCVVKTPSDPESAHSLDTTHSEQHFKGGMGFAGTFHPSCRFSAARTLQCGLCWQKLG